jgi:oxygen-independent coproporphyrinogen-3 oxidase
VTFTLKMSGLYIHIPYCKQACNYCDFHFSTSLGTKTELVNSMVRELEIRKDYLDNKQLQSLYFGGGTPSLLLRSEMEILFEAINKIYKIEPSSEITIECNPDDVTEANLIDWRELGFNRLSIGLQSFDDIELKWMNRAHNASESLACVKLAQSKGFKNISIDLIYGSKFQTESSWHNTLQKIIELNIQHISAYNLTIENGTLLGYSVKKGNEPTVREDFSAWQFETLVKELVKSGFIHYEISNFAKPDFFAVHNSNYWRQKTYIGIGPSAHSYNLKSRQWNLRNNQLYIKAIGLDENFFETEILTRDNQFNEYILTGLRTKWGCSLKQIEMEFGSEIKSHCLTILNKNKTHLLLENDVFCLTDAGKLYADKISADFFI